MCCHSGPHGCGNRERAEVAAQESKFLEFRLDALAKPAAALAGLKEFLGGHRDVMAIATCRRKEFGGSFVGSLTAELDVLLGAAEAGCSIVDLEVESAEQAKPAQLARFRAGLREAGTALLVSFHDFTRTKAWSRRPLGLKPSSRTLSKWFRQRARSQTILLFCG